MKEEKSLATLLAQFMGAAEIGDARLASLVNAQVGITSFLHRSTVRNWRNGSSKSVKDWRQLAAIAAALNLDRENTDQLLFAGGCPPVDTLKKMANEDDQSFLIPWKAEQLAVAPPQQSVPIVPDEVEANTSVPSTSDELKASITVGSFPTPKKSGRSAVPRLLKIAVPAVLVLSLLSYGLSRWMGGTETGESFTTAFNQTETDGPFTFYSDEIETKWDYTIKSWNSTVEPLNTDLAFQGDQVLNVKLSEYAGVSFFHEQPIDTEPYGFLQFYIRRADGNQEDSMSLSILVDDDGEFTNGEVGRTIVDDYLEEEITAEKWHKVEIPLNAFSPRPFAMSQLAIQGFDPGGTPRFWVDQVQLVADTDESLIIYSDQTRMHWDFTSTSWDVTAESLETGLAVKGNHVLDVKLGEYAGLSFSHDQPVNTGPYSFLQLYVRPTESNDISLTVMLDDDDDLDNGEIGRTMINNYLEEEMMVEEWHEVKIPLDAFSPEPFTVSRLVIHSPLNGSTPHFWVDQIQLVRD